ncbi:MFS transporter [Clostridium folliculivorans]|uniref:MFS-type transporter YbcL n=1 Tax=Clostridium folliculivorans TaxID=2886038 RepID=A0A9W5Y0J7_9CLOT|nr:MFS transporter [Clostridium folliculivorans]GKU24275.1 putative MFS-type transporter YbcL [Clostridium folliculivorans]GKU30380.1 putative MFS-type transporter YbcL [Clostridium folliculivorans]
MDNKINNTWKIYLLTFISFLSGTLQFVIGGILDKIAVSVGVPISTAGQLGTAFSLAGAIGTPVIIMITAKMDGRKRLLMGLTAILLSTFSTVVLPGFGFLMVSRIVLGIGMGVYGISAYSIVAKLAPPERLARAMSNLSMGSSASLVIGVPIGRVVANSYGWKSIFWAIGFFIILAMIAAIMYIPTSKAEAPIPLGNQLAYLKKPRIAMYLGAAFFMFISYSVVNSYITPFLIGLMPLIEGKMSIILMGLGIASVVGAKLGGFYADRLGARSTLVGGMAIQAFALILISIVPKTVVLICPLLMIWAIAAWICGPTFNFNLISVAPEASGIMLSLNSTFVQFGFAAGAGIGGIVLRGFSIIAISWVGAIAVVLAACVALAAFGHTNLSTMTTLSNEELDLEQLEN